MDKELAKLHDITRNMLIDVQRNLLAKKPVPGFSPSDLKKVRKAISNLDFDTESYGDIMEKNVSNPKGLMKAIRNQETRVMRAFELLPDDTIHHLVQQRTGGDFSLNVSGDTVRNAVSRLQDRFQMRFGQYSGPTGTVRGDTAFSNFAHKADDRATGLEKLSGIGKNTDPSTTAHRYGTAGYSKTLTAAETADADALVEALAPRISNQLEDVKVGIQTDSPRVEAVRALDPRLKDAYKATNTAEDIAEMKGVIQTIPEENIIQTYRPLPEFKGGSMRLKAARAIPFVGPVVAAYVAGGQVLAGDLVGAGGTLLDEAVSEVGLDSQPAASGTLTDAPRQHQAILERQANPTVADKIIKDPLNELEYVGKQVMSFFGGAIRMASPLGL